MSRGIFLIRCEGIPLQQERAAHNKEGRSSLSHDLRAAAHEQRRRLRTACHAGRVKRKCAHAAYHAAAA